MCDNGQSAGEALAELEGATALRMLADVCEAPIDDAMPHDYGAVLGAVLTAQAVLLRAVATCPDVCAKLDLSELAGATEQVEEWLSKRPARWRG